MSNIWKSYVCELPKTGAGSCGLPMTASLRRSPHVAASSIVWFLLNKPRHSCLTNTSAPRPPTRAMETGLLGGASRRRCFCAATRSRVPDYQHVAILDDVLFAFETQQPLFLDAGITVMID